MGNFNGVDFKHTNSNQDTADVKGFNQFFRNIGRKKCRKRRAETKIFESKMQQRKYGHHKRIYTNMPALLRKADWKKIKATVLSRENQK